MELARPVYHVALAALSKDVAVLARLHDRCPDCVDNHCACRSTCCWYRSRHVNLLRTLFRRWLRSGSDVRHASLLRPREKQDQQYQGPNTFC